MAKVRSEIIHSLRESKGWSQELLAKKAGIDPKTMSNLLNGSECRLSTISLIAVALRVEPGQLIKVDNPDPPPDSPLLKTDNPVSQVGSSVRITDTGTSLVLQFELNVSKEAVAQSEQLTAIVKILLKLLPDKANIAIIGVTGTTAFVSVAMTPANVLATECEIPRSGLKLLTAVGPEHYMVDGRIELLTDTEIAGVAYNAYARTYESPDEHSPTGYTEMTQDEALIFFLDPTNYGANTKSSQSVYLWLQRRLYSGKLRGLQERVAQWRRQRKPNWLEEWKATQKPGPNPQGENSLPLRD